MEAPHDPEALRLSDDNLAGFVRHTANAGRDTTVVEEDRLLLVAGSHSHPGPYRNMAVSLGDELEPQTAFRRARDFFAERRRGFVFWSRDHADQSLDPILETHGGKLLEPDGLPQFFLDHRPEPAEPPPGVDLVPVRSVAEGQDLLRINAESWGIAGVDLELAAAMLFEPRSLIAPNVAAVVAYIGDEAVSGAMGIVTDAGAVGGYWAATPTRTNRLWVETVRRGNREHRGRGPHDLCARAIVNAGFDLGARAGVCQASETGLGTVLRMGFRPVTRYRRYLFPALIARNVAES